MKIPSKLFLSAFLVQALALTACGGGSGSSGSSSSSSSSSAASLNSFTLYKDGSTTLALDGGVENSLVTVAWELNEGEGNIVSDPEFETATGMVWDIEFGGLANVSLTPEEFVGIEGSTGAVRYANMAETGQLVFDIRVLDIDPETELLAKIDSPWPFASYQAIEIPEDDEWHTIEVPFSEMVGTQDPWGTGDMQLSHVVSLFVLEAVGGGAHVQINDVRITCMGDCGIEPDVKETLTESFDVLMDGEVSEHWFGVDHFDNATESIIVTTTEDDSGDAKGTVTNATFTGEVAGPIYVTTFDYKDLSAFASNGGYLEFDLRVLDAGASSGEFLVWVSSPGGSSASYVIIPSVALGEWETVTVEISDLLIGGHPDFDLATIAQPFVFFPMDDQTGVHVQLDNVRWVVSE